MTGPYPNSVYDSPNPSGNAAGRPARSRCCWPCHSPYSTWRACRSKGGRSCRVDRERAREPARRRDAAEDDVGERVATLHPRVPRDEDGRHGGAPPLGDDGAAGDEHGDGARLRGGDGPQQRLVRVAEGERDPVATLRSLRPGADRVVEAAGLRRVGCEGRKQREELGVLRRVEVLALVGARVADDHDRGVGGGREGGRAGRVGAVVMDDDVAERGPQPGERRHDLGRPHVARRGVAGVDPVGERPDHGEASQPRPLEGQHRRPVDRLVAQQHTGPLRDLAGQGAMRRAGDVLERRRLGRHGEAGHGREQANAPRRRRPRRGRRRVDEARQVVCVVHAEGHLDVLAGERRRAASRIPKIQSVITNPSNPHRSRRISVSSGRFSPHQAPFTEL